VVVGVVGVGGGGALEERDGVVTLAAGGDALIVDDLGERKTKAASASAYLAELKRARPR
jgi:hypothetical protein